MGEAAFTTALEVEPLELMTIKREALEDLEAGIPEPFGLKMCL